MTSESPGTSSFFSKIGNADATRRFIHDIAPAMSVDEGDHLTLATVTTGKSRKETTIGRLDKADEAEIVAFIQREVTSHGEGRYKVRYTGANGRRNGSRTFTYPVDQGKRRVPVKAPTPPAQPPTRPARKRPTRRHSPPPRVAELAPSPETVALEAKVRELTTALTDLDSENSSLYQQLERERAALAKLREEARATEQRRAGIENAVAETEATARQMESERAELEEERDRLLDRVSQAEATSGEQAARIKKLKAKLRRATDEREDLTRQLTRERARPRPADHTPKLQTLQRRLKKAAGDRERLQQSLNQHKQATAREIATCTKEIEMIDDDRLKQRERVLQLEKENEKLQRQVRSLEAENAAGADYIRRMRGIEDDEDDDGYVAYDFGEDDDEDY